ncbi:hypothetical protein MKW92_006694 [Papaver armeniacum]|nr:hypothetical protein MKW92_006694 [Papaver armeniacum]
MSPQNYLPTNLDDNSVEEILVKLPVKSLMRFKCSHSHHSRSKTHPQLLISIDSTYNGASKIFYSPENEFEGGLALHKVTIFPWSRQAVMLKPIDGLFCCVDDIYGVTCIYNLGTRQVTPWAQSSIPLQGGHSLTGMPIYGFGFDPLTSNYKVLRVWEITRHWHGYAMESVYHICEVFTVGGENQWRKIDEVPPVRLYERPAGVYANGSIYWRKAPAKGFGLRPQDDKMLVAFDVGSEKFRKIITDRWTHCFNG